MKIPQELISKKQWLVWKTVTRDGKSTKIPLQPNGNPAKTNDPETWSSFETVALAAKTFDGPGFVFSADDPYVGIDLDGCRDSEGKVAEWAKEIIQKFDSYSEVSPSGSGVKIFVKGELKDERRKCNPDVFAVTDKLPGIEVYSKGRYFAVTGERLGGISPNVEHRQEALDWLSKKYLTQSSKPAPQAVPLSTDEQVIKRAEKYLEKIPGAISGQRGHDRAFHAACVLILGFGLERQDAYALLSHWNQTCDPPWSEKELNHKLDDAAKHPGERNYLRDKLPEHWDRVSVPRYTQFTPQPEVKAPLEIGTTEEAAVQYLEESKSGKRNRLISTGLSKLDEAIGGGYELGEMIILAARPSHGKSAFSLQMAHSANEQGLPGIMISEEMPRRLIGKRTIQFVSEIPEEDWHSHHVAVGSELFEHFKGREKTYIVESCITSKRVVEEIEKAVDERGVKFAVVDYAQLLKSDGKTRFEQTTNTSIALRSTASRLGISVICLCQLSRNIESRGKFIPTMADIKETGQFEQDADVILALVWPHKVNQSEHPHDYQIFVMKNRNRAIVHHALQLKFNPSRQTVLEDKPKFANGWPDAPGDKYGFDD